MDSFSPIKQALSLVDGISQSPTTKNSDAASTSTTTQVPSPALWEELMGDGIVMKRLSPRTLAPTAEVGTTVTCKVTGRILEGVLPPTTYSSTSSAIATLKAASEPFDKFERLSVTIDEHDVVPGLELALRHSCKGSHFFVRCAPKFAYGSQGRKATELSPEVPPETAVEYEVEVLDHLDNVTSTLSPAQQCGFDVNLRKEAGNRWYSYGDFRRAAQSYSKGIKTAEGFLGNSEGPSISSSQSDNEREEALNEQANRDQIFQLWMACLNNLAACKISLKEFRVAKEICTSILEQDPRNIKALLRAGKASMELDEFEECELCLKTVMQIDPNNAVVMNEMKRLRQAEREYKSKSREMASKMAQKLFSPAQKMTSNGDSQRTATPTETSRGETESPSASTATTTASSTTAEATIAVTGSGMTSLSSLLLLGTSFLVVLVSIALALYIKSKRM